MGIDACAQETVYGGGLPAGDFRQPLGGAAGGSGQHAGQPHLVIQTEDAPHNGCFTGTGAAGYQQKSRGGGIFDRLGLLVGICKTPILGRRFHHPAEKSGFGKVAGGKILQTGTAVDLRFIKGGQIDNGDTRKHSTYKLLRFHQLLQRAFCHGRLHRKQRGGGTDELFLRQEAVTGTQVVTQLEENACLYPAGVIPCKAQVDGKTIHRPEGRIQTFLRQQIGVIIEHIHGSFPIELVGFDCQFRTQMMQREEFQQAPHSHLQPEFLADLSGPFFRNTRNDGQPFRLPLHDTQGIVPKMVHDPGGDPGADSLDDSAGEVGENIVCALRHHPFQKFRLELTAVAAVGGPLAGDHQPLTQTGQGNGTYHCGGLAVFQL